MARKIKSQKTQDEPSPVEALTFIRRVGCLLGDSVKPCVYSHGDKLFVAGSYEDQVEVFEFEHLRPKFSFSAPFKIRYLQCYADVSVVSDGLQVLKYERSEFSAMFCSEHPILQIMATPNNIFVLGASCLQMLASDLAKIADIAFEADDGQAACWMFHPRSHQNHLLIGHSDGSIALWDLKRRAKVRTVKTTTLPSLVCHGPDDSNVVFGWAEGRVQVFDIDASLLLADFSTPKSLVALAFRQDSVPQLLTFHDDSVSMWEFKNQVVDCIHSAGLPFKTLHAECIPNKPVLVCFGPNQLRECLLEYNKLTVIRERAGIPVGVDFVQFYSEGNFNEMLTSNICTMSSSDPLNPQIGVQNIFSDSRGFNLSYKKEFPSKCSMVALFDKRGVPWANLVSAHHDCTFSWSVPERKIYPDSKQQFPSMVTLIAISPCGNFYSVGCLDGAIHVLVLQSHRRILSKFLPVGGKGHSISCVHFDASGRGLLWVTSLGHVLYSPDFRNQSAGSIAEIEGCQKVSHFNADSWLLFLVDSDLNIVTIDIEFRRIARIFSGHVAPITSIASSDDGRWLFSASQDCTIRIWDISSGIQCHQCSCNYPPRTLALSPHGRFLVSSHVSQVGLRLWSFDATKIKHKQFSSVETYASFNQDEGDLALHLDGMRITPMKDQHKWQSVINWSQSKARAAPKVAIETSPSIPFFLSELALDELKRKEKASSPSSTAESWASDFSLKHVDFDFGQDSRESSKRLLELVPSQIHSLFYFMGPDVAKHGKMLDIFECAVGQCASGLVPFDIAISVVKVYLEYHLEFLKANFPDRCKQLSESLEMVYCPFEARLQHLLGDIAFATGNII